MEFRSGVSHAQPLSIALWLRRRKRRAIAAFILMMVVLTIATARHLQQNASPQIGDRLFVTVTRVVDERTFEVCSTADSTCLFEVRLDGLAPLPAMSAPHIRHELESWHAQPLTLIVRQPATPDRPLAADAYPHDGPLLSSTLLMQGLARVDAATAHPLRERFFVWQRTAQQKHLGHWAHTLSATARNPNPPPGDSDVDSFPTSSWPAPNQNPTMAPEAAMRPGTRQASATRPK